MDFIKVRQILTIIIITLFSGIAFASTWTPSSIEEPDHPRILFTSEDSAEIASRLTTSPFSSYYSSIWSRANSTSSNSDQYSDFVRSGIAMSAAYVLYFGVKPSGDTLTTSERDDLITKCNNYLDNLITTMDSRFDNSNYHYPCERLIQYCVAYDLLAGAGIPASSSRIADLSNTIYDNATYWLLSYVVDDISLFMNHKLIVAGALGTAAVCLPSEGGEWIDYAMTKINHVVFTDETDPGVLAGFAEGPHYFRYSMEHMVQFIVGMKHYVGDITDYYEDPCGGEENGSIRTVWFDPRWDLLYEWISSIRMPNGQVPPMDDCFRHDGFSLTAPFAERDPSFFWETSPGVSRMFVYPLLVSIGAEPGPSAPAGLTCLPDAGNLIFRSDTGEAAIYFHMSGEHGTPNTGTHDQSDAASYMIQAYGEDVAIDPGYISWSERSRVNDIDKHNTIMINDGGPNPTLPVDAYIDRAFEIKNLYLGKVRTNYSSADIVRSSAMVSDRIVVIFDDIARDSNADFTFQCHSEGLESSGSFAMSGQSGVWTGADSAAIHLVSEVINSPDEIVAENSTHETGYNSWADHTAMRLTKNATQTKFISLLFPFKNGMDILRWNVLDIGNQATIRFAFEGKEGIILARYDSTPLDFPGDSLFPSISGSGEGLIAIIDSATANTEVIYAFASESLYLSDDLVYRTASDTIDIGLSFYNDTIQGYLNGSDETICIGLDSPPFSVTGTDSWSWTDCEIELVISNFTEFIIETAPLSIENNLSPEQIEIGTYPNPFNRAVHIDYSRKATTQRIEILDICGKQVDILENNATLWEPSQSTTAGIYFVKIAYPDGQAISRILYVK